MGQMNLRYELTNVSNDYTLLHHLKGNRYGGGVNQVINIEKQSKDFKRKVNEIVKSMKENGYDVNFPIVVAIINNVFYILDGQHRYAAAVECGIPYHFIVKPEITTIKEANDYCEKMNNSKKSHWTIEEYIYRIINDTDTYSLGLRYKYQLIIDLSKRFNLPVSLICDLLIGEGSTKTGGVIKKGLSFEVKTDVFEICLLAETISKKEPNFGVVMTSRTFVRNISKMYRNPYFDNEMLTRVKEYVFNFEVSRLKYDDYIQGLLEKVCNYKRHVNKIYLTKISGTLR